MDSSRTPLGLQWTPCGLLKDSAWTPVDSVWTPGGLRPNPWLSVKSSVCGLHEASHTNLYCLWELSSYIRNTVSDSAVGDTWASSSSNSYSKILRKLDRVRKVLDYTILILCEYSNMYSLVK